MNQNQTPSKPADAEQESGKGLDETICSDSPADGTICDCCEKPAVKTMSDKTSKWCANYFVGYYCEGCYRIVEDTMQQIVEEEAAKFSDPNVPDQQRRTTEP